MGNMFLRKYKYFLFLVFSISCLAQPGKDGALTISTSKTVLNRYSRVTTDILAGSNTVTVVDINDLNRDAIPYLPAGYVSNPSSFNSNALSKGDLIMLYQAQGALINTTNSINYGSVNNINGAGNYELAYVESVSGNIITLSCTSKLSYFTARYVQVIRIPQYTTLTIDSGASVVAIPWGDPTFGGGTDPSASERRRGGFNAVIANNIVNNGSVNANQAGFRGGTRENSSAAAAADKFYLDFRATDARLSAEKGESIVGYGIDYDAIGGRYGRGAAANGGGGGNAHNAGGGGGANGGNVINWFRGAGVMNDFGTCGIPGAWALDPNYIENGLALTNSAGGGHGGYSYGKNTVDADACTVGPSYPADFIAPGVPTATVLSSPWDGDFRDAVGGLGGRPVTSPNYQNQIFFGGGGGAGDGNNDDNSDGGDGGGIVFLVVTNSISGSGVIQANGENGFDTIDRHTDAPGGGGGGGTVLIQSNTITNTQSVNANGGSGGNQLITTIENEGPGGGGGGGVLAINATTDGSIKTVAGGSNGTTTSSSLTEFKANGATSGNSGSILSIAVNLNYSECQLDLQTIKTVNNTTPLIDASIVFTITVTNNGPLDATGVIATDAIPSGYTVTAVSTTAGTWLAPNWTIGNLINGQTATLNITAKVNPTGIYTNTSTVTGTLKDSNLSNNTSSVCITPITPTIVSTIATCSAAGTSKINNYNPSNTYVFSPPTIGITIDGTGLISGLVPDTAYTVTAVNGNCTSSASISFSNESQIALPTIPVLTSNSPICVGSSVIFTITGTAGNEVTYTGALSGKATIDPLGVVSVTIPNVTNAATLNLTNIANGSCNRALTSTITVTPQALPNAGTNGTLTVCQGTTPTDKQLFDQLGGTPDAGGTWSNLANVYTYTVAAIAPCTTNATATVTVTKQAPPNAGTNGTLTVCQGTTPTNTQLFNQLGGTHDTGGTWSNLANIYTYTVAAIAPCTTNATATVTVTTQAPPNAGTNGTLTVCQGTTPTNTQLFAQLGGTPAAGGIWSSSANVYTYTVAATAPCTGNATATVTVTTQAFPNAGTNGTLTICQGTTPTNTQLFAQLGGTPNSGGNWSNIANVYTYTVAATAPCTGNATATVTVTTQAFPNAGTNGTLTICQGTTPTNAQLFAQLGGTPTSGGTWSNIGNVYIYTVAAIAPCTTNATATVTVTTQALPNAGTNGTLTICQGTTPTNAQLFGQLGGTPTSGGTWSNLANVYAYTVAAIAPCTGNATATVTVTPQAPPNAGTNGTLTVCQGTTPTNAQLFARLGGTPSSGGTWSNLANVYTYTVAAIAPCTTNATATVTVTTNALPILGITGSTALSVGATISLIPNTGGTWISSNSATATVTNGGLVTGVATGQVNFTFNAINGCSNTTESILVSPSLLPIISISDAATVEGGNIVFSVVLSKVHDADIILTFDYRNGTAADSDYTKTITLLIPKGTNTATLTVASLEDSIDELDETFNLSIGTCNIPGVGISDTAIGTILNNDIDAVNDIFMPIDGVKGGITPSLLINDTIGLKPVVISDVILTNLPLPTGLTLQSNGTIIVAPGTPPGSYPVTYTICKVSSPNICDTAVSSVIVTETIIVANDDDYKTPINSAIGGEIKNIISNDLLNGVPVVSTNVIISLVNPSSNLYNFTVDNNGNFSIPEGLPKGSYRVEYQICEKLNPTNCTTSFVLFEVIDPCDFDDSPSSCDLIVHNAISPDDVNSNKIFTIEGIEKYSNNKVEIYNRWGVLVYQVEGYDNNQRSFNGYSDGRSTIKQIEKLPEGTYYYTIQYVKNNGLSKKVAGFLFIER